MLKNIPWKNGTKVMEEGAARKKRGDERVMKEKTWMKDEWMR